MKGIRVFLVAVACILVASIVPNGSSGGPKVPDPGQMGPYAVGHMSLMLSDPLRPCDLGARPIPVEVFYPVDPDTITGATPEAAYPLDPINSIWPTTLSSDWEAYGMDRAYEGTAPSSNKPFPLIVFSPGWGATIWAHIFVGTRLASHGFVVAIMYHYGDAWFLWEQFDHIAAACINRPLDVSYVLSDLLARNSGPVGLLKGLINPNLIAASGWSLGGYASMELAAGIDNVGDYFNQSPWIEYFGPPPPESFVALSPDPRIKAIVPLDGSNQVFEFYELARVKVPSMGIGQEWSMLALDPGWEAWQARQHAAFLGKPSYRVDVGGALHPSFSNMCEAINMLLAKGIIDQAFYDSFWGFACAIPLPNATAHRLTTKYMIAFLKTNLCGDQGYQNLLTPGYVHKNEPLLEFFVAEPGHPNSIGDWPAWPAAPEKYWCFMHQPGSEQFLAEKNPKKILMIPHMGMKRQK